MWRLGRDWEWWMFKMPKHVKTDWNIHQLTKLFRMINKINKKKQCLDYDSYWNQK